MSKELDLHFHTRINSRCSITTVQDLIRVYRRHRTPIVITDHRSDVSWIPPVPHIFGREVHVAFPAALGKRGTTDILVFGWNEKWVKVDNETNGTFQGTLEEFLEIYKQPHTALVSVHPSRNYHKVVNLPAEFERLFKAVDAVEVFNGCDFDHHYVMNYGLASRLGVPMVAGSDDHYGGHGFKSEYTIFEEDVTNVFELVQQIKQGKVKPYMDMERYLLISCYEEPTRNYCADLEGIPF